MFVDIENYKSPLAIENLLTPYKKGLVIDGVRQPKAQITTDVCFEVLRSTNYPRSIKDMLVCIAELPHSEQAQFKDVVLAIFDHREQSEDIVRLGYELAFAHDFIHELSSLRNIDNDYPSYLASSTERILTIERNSGYLENAFFEGYDRLLCLADGCVRLGCSDITKKKILPKIIDAPNSEYLNFLGEGTCDGFKLRKIVVKNGGSVAMTDVYPLPEQVDLTSCKRVIVGFDDLAYTKNWTYQPDALTCSEHDLDMSDGVWDFSACGRVVLYKCSVNDKTNMLFRKGTEIDFYKIESQLPDNIDFSECSSIVIDMDDLSNLKNLCFRKGAKVTFENVKKLPPNLDFSPCDKVDLFMCDLSNVERLIFKNQEQKMNSEILLPPDWKGKIIYADEQSQASLNLAMMQNSKGGR